MTRNIPGSATALSCCTIVPTVGFPTVKCTQHTYSGFSSLALELLHFQRFAALVFEAPG